MLMGYYNPIYVYGVDKFLEDAKAAGVDGLIVVDLPPEEDDELCIPAMKAGVNFIRLATPTTDDKRAPAVFKNTIGFVYYVSVLGITGTKAPDLESVAANVKRLKGHTTLPICRGLRRQDRRTGPRHCQERRWRGGGIGPGFGGRESLTKAGKPTAQDGQSRAHAGQRNCPGREELEHELDQEFRPPAKSAPSSASSAMCPRTCGSRIPNPARWCSTRILKPTSSCFRARAITTAWRRTCASSIDVRRRRL